MICMYIYTYLCISIINKGYIYLHVYYNVHKSLVPRWFFESVARIGNILYDLIPTYTNVQYMYVCILSTTYLHIRDVRISHVPYVRKYIRTQFYSTYYYYFLNPEFDFLACFTSRLSPVSSFGHNLSQERKSIYVKPEYDVCTYRTYLLLVHICYSYIFTTDRAPPL